MKKTVVLLIVVLLSGCLEQGNYPDEAVRLKYSPQGDIAIAFHDNISVFDSNLRLKEVVSPPPFYQYDSFVWTKEGGLVALLQGDTRYNAIPYLLVDLKRNLTLAISSTFLETIPYNDELSISPDGKFIALSSDINKQVVYIIDTQKWAIIRQIKVEDISAARFSFDELIVEDGEYGTLKKYHYYSLPEFSFMKTVSNRTDSLAGLSGTGVEASADLDSNSIYDYTIFFRNNRSDNFTIPCWDLFQKSCSYFTASFSRDGRYLATASSPEVVACHREMPVCGWGGIVLFDTKTRKIIFSSANYTQGIGFDWSPNGKKLAYTFDGNDIEVLDVETMNVTGKRISAGPSLFG